MNDILELLKKLGIERKEDIIVNEKGEKGLSSFIDNGIIECGITDEEYLEMCNENKMLPDHSIDGKKSIDDYMNDIKAEGKEASVLHRSRILVFRGSDETVDRHGDIVRVDGWKLDDYKKNPVFLVGHDYSKMPVGRAVKVRKDNNDVGSATGKSLKFWIHFPAKEVSKDSETIFQLYKSKLLTSVSVGFMPTKMNNPQTEEERNALGLGKYGVEFTEQKLWELSAVPLPSNTNAVQVLSAVLGVSQKTADDKMDLLFSTLNEIKDTQKEILKYINKDANHAHDNDDDADPSDSSNEDISKSIYDQVFGKEDPADIVTSILSNLK